MYLEGVLGSAIHAKVNVCCLFELQELEVHTLVGTLEFFQFTGSRMVLAPSKPLFQSVLKSLLLEVEGACILYMLYRHSGNLLRGGGDCMRTENCTDLANSSFGYIA
jgi:hypothetical protein